MIKDNVVPILEILMAVVLVLLTAENLESRDAYVHQ